MVEIVEGIMIIDCWLRDKIYKNQAIIHLLWIFITTIVQKPEDNIMDLIIKTETWLFIIISLCVATSLKTLSDIFFPKPNLPQRPTKVPVIGNFLWLRKSLLEFKPVLRDLHTKYVQILTLHFGPYPIIFVSSNSLADQALVRKGAVFADHLEAMAIGKNISLAFYDLTWRVLRRNLTTEILHPLQVRS